MTSRRRRRSPNSNLITCTSQAAVWPSCSRRRTTEGRPRLATATHGARLDRRGCGRLVDTVLGGCPKGLALPRARWLSLRRSLAQLGRNRRADLGRDWAPLRQCHSYRHPNSRGSPCVPLERLRFCWVRRLGSDAHAGMRAGEWSRLGQRAAWLVRDALVLCGHEKLRHAQRGDAGGSGDFLQHCRHGSQHLPRPKLFDVRKH